jgi:Protein of unknown function (DUF2924)
MAPHKPYRVGDVMPGTEVERRVAHEIKALATATVPDLKARWTALTGREPPRFAKRSLLTRLIAWEMQAKTLGGLDPVLRRCLLASGSGARAVGEQGVIATPPAALRPGVKLIRSWKGVTHHVAVVEGGFVWQERAYKSLSVIARKITGTSWSGPVFFGLKKTKASRTIAAESGTGVSAHS